MKRILLSSLVASLLITGSFATETASKDATAKEVSTLAVKHAKEAANTKNNEIKTIQDAVDSLKFAHEALAALNKGDTKTATKNIELALGKLEVTLAAKNAPELLPVESVVSVDEFIGSSTTVRGMVKLAEDLLEDYKVQAAKEVLDPLKSEIVIDVVNLPLTTYPDALKETAKLIHEGKTQEATTVLETALDTLVEVQTVTPIPLVKATDLIAAAAEVAEKDPKKAEEYLKAAQEELKISKYLGYVSKSDITYKTLDDAIDDLKSDITSSKVKNLFKELKEKVKDFSDKIFINSDKK